jgi:hypothetical protein
MQEINRRHLSFPSRRRIIPRDIGTGIAEGP